MEPLVIVLVPGLVGGFVLAMLMARKHINLRPSGAGRLEPPSPSLINMAHIRVQGGGGLGIVAAVIAVAVFDPRIRLMIGFAVLCGGVVGAVLIMRRRADGPFPSGPDGSGPHSLLGLDRTGSPDRHSRDRDQTVRQPPATLTPIRSATA